MDKRAIAKNSFILLGIVLLLGIIIYGAEVFATVSSVALSTPVNNTYTNDTMINFTVQPSGNSSTYNCTLYINDTIKGNNPSVSDSTPTIINSTLSNGTYSWYFNCQDSDNNLSSPTRSITIDNAVPVIAVHASVIAEATSPGGAIATYTSPNATDLVNGTFPATCLPASGTSFSMGNTTVTCTATDSAGNGAVPTTFNVTVQDTTGPTTTPNAGAYVFGNWTNSTVIVNLANCSDISSGCNITHYCIYEPGSIPCLVTLNYSSTISISTDGIHYLLYYSIDTAGNSESVKNKTIKIDKEKARIVGDQMYASPDNFVCALPGYKKNENTTLIVNVTDSAGVAWVRGDVSSINPGAGMINFTHNNATGFWEATFTANDTSSYNFDNKEIQITADDFGNNGVESDMPIPLILYSMTNPPMPNETCDRQTDASTNFCDLTDFNHVNFTQEIEKNGSMDCSGTQHDLPWGNTFQKVITLTFEDMNFSDSETMQNLHKLGEAIRPFITPPTSFEPSYIYVDTSALAALNTNTTITMYNLPFTEEPHIAGENGSGAVVTSFVQNTPYIISTGPSSNMTVPNATLSFSVSHFSQYNVSDTEAPIVSFTLPASNASTGLVSYTIKANGTGTQLSNISLYVNGVLNESLSSSEILGYCSNLTSDWSVVSCPGLGPLNFSTEGTQTLTAVAYDYGGGAAPGIMGNSTIYINIDTTAPNTTATNPGATWQKANFNVTLTPTDLPTGSAAGIRNTTYLFNGTWYNGTTIVVNISGAHTIVYYSVDNLGHVEANKTLVALLDKVAPSTTDSYNLTGWQPSAVTISLTPVDALSGVNYTTYNVDNGSWVNSTTITISTSGNHTIYYYSVDNAGNVESTQNKTNILVDVTAPTTTFLAHHSSDNGSFVFDEWNNLSAINVTLSGTDNTPGSGYNSTYYCNDTTNTCTPTTLFIATFNVTASGITYIRAKSMDNKGNNETVAVKRVMILTSNSTYANSSNVTVNSSQTTVLLPENNTAMNITVSSSVNGTLNVAEGLNLSTGNATLDGSVTVDANTSIGTVEVSFPAGLVISGNSSWTGIINLPKPVPASSVSVTADSGYDATIALVYEVGSDNVSLTFSQAVRINLVGQSGKDVGFYRNGAFTPITATCTGDNQTWANTTLAAGGDCSKDSGSDLIVWTKHFTSFITYTQTAQQTTTTNTNTDTSSDNHNSTGPICGAWSTCLDGKQTRTCPGIISNYTQTQSCTVATPPNTTPSATNNTATTPPAPTETINQTATTPATNPPVVPAKKKGSAFIWIGIILVVIIVVIIVSLVNHNRKNKGQDRQGQDRQDEAHNN